MKVSRNEYTNSLDQLMTTSCILAGFAFSGLIALPGIEKEMFHHIVISLNGDFLTSFYISFYALFFSSVCFLSSIMTILVYKANNFTIPLAKLRNIHLIANLTFAIAISSLIISVISFGVPNMAGITIAILFGFGVGGSFIWENLLPKQKSKRQDQVKKENDEENDEENDKAKKKNEAEIEQDNENGIEAKQNNENEK